MRISLGLAAGLLSLVLLTACTGRTTQQPSAPTARTANASMPIAFSADGTSVWVVNPDADTVTRIDVASLVTDPPIDVGREPWGIAVAPNGTLAVLNRLDGTLSILSEGGRTDVYVGAEPGGVALTPGGGHAWVSVSATAELVLVDLDQARVVQRISVGAQPWGLAVTPEAVAMTHRLARRSGSQASEAWLTLLREGELIEVSLPGNAFGFPNVSESLAVQGDAVYLAHLLNSPDLPNDFQTTVAGGLSAVSLSNGAELPGMRLNLNDPAFATPTNFPRAIASHPEQPLLFIALAGSNSVMAVDVSQADNPRLVGFWPTGSNPRGIAISPDGKVAFVMNYLSRDVSVLDLSDPGKLTSHTELARVSVTAETLSPALLQGKVLFNNSSDPRMSRNGWISCASCHPDGSADGTTWDLGEGPRQTMPLWNLAGTEPLHAAGTRDEVQDFEFDIEQLMGGIGLAPGPARPLLLEPNSGTSDALDALALFVRQGIRPPVAAAPTDAARQQRGRDLFVNRGCAGCHYGPTWTGAPQSGEPGSLDPSGAGVVTHVLHDVGTFNPADDLTGQHGFGVPTLLGLHATPPYFHDGSAASLMDLLTHSGHSGAAFAEADAADLVAFLLSIDGNTTAFHAP